MNELSAIYLVAPSFAGGFLACVLLWLMVEYANERRQRKSPWISPEVLREAAKNRRELP